ncbi:hypothetical protein TNCV_4093761 [Trichonephila clavipes]|nr:hypothetical protein TNCV_4093761 [Trichonephila clavipes]
MRMTSIDRNSTTVLRVWNRWVQEGNALQDINGLLPKTSERIDMYTGPQTLSQEVGLFAARQFSTLTVRRRLVQNGLSILRPTWQL